MKKFTLFLTAVLLALSTNLFAADYVKVTEAPADWSGEYLLVYEKSTTEAYVWTGVDGTPTQVTCFDKATIANNTITGDAFVTLTIAKSGDGYSVLINGGTNNGKYSSRTSYSNGIDFTSTVDVHTFIYDDASGLTMKASGGCAMKFNSASDQLRFRYYKSGQKPVQLYKLKEVCEGYAVTIDAENTDNGTISVDVETACEGATVTLTATPNEGYVFEGWYVLDGEGKEVEVAEDNTFIMPASAVTVAAFFRLAETFTITWIQANDVITTTATEGQPIVAPEAVALQNKTFMGWSATKEVATDGTDFAAVDFATTTAIANVTYYAVFATQDITGDAVYKKITTNEELTDGKYLLVAESNSTFYAAGTRNGTNAYSSYTTATVTDNTISAKPENAAEFTIVKIDDTQFAMNDGENWITAKSTNANISYTSLDQATPTDVYWKLNNGYIQSTNNSKYFGYNSGSPRFAVYASTTGQQVGAQLYKYSQTISITDYVVATFGVALAGEPNKTAYKVGEKFEKDGLKVMAKYLTGDVDVTEQVEEWVITPEGAFSEVGSLEVEVMASYKDEVASGKYTVVVSPATGLEEAVAPAAIRKTIENGQLVIIREGVKYNAQGAVIR